MNNFVDMLNALKPYTYLKNAIGILVCMLCVTYSSAQTDSLFKAQEYCSIKKFTEAKRVIDNVVLHPETKNDPAGWHIKAYTYLQLYQLAGKNNSQKSFLLDTMVSSASKSIKFDTNKEYLDVNIKFIENAANKFFSISKVTLQDSIDYEKSEIYFQKYKSTVKITRPSFDFREKEIEYYSAVGTQYADLFTTNSTFQARYGEIAKSAFYLVLDHDPKNIKANYNLGVIFYNQAATLMKQMDYDIDLASLDIVQENAKRLFKQSLPYMTKVYEIEPKDKRVLEGLSGIYDGLNEKDKSIEFIKKKEALEQKK